MFRAKMADGHRNKVQLSQNRFPRQLRHLITHAVESVRCPKPEVDLVYIADEFKRLFLPEVLLQVPPDVWREGHFAIAEGTCSSQTAYQVAGRAREAFNVLVVLVRYKAIAVFQVLALLQEEGFYPCCLG